LPCGRFHQTGLPGLMPYFRPVLCILLLLTVPQPVRATGTEPAPGIGSQATPVTDSAWPLGPVMVSAESNEETQQIDPAMGTRTYQLGPEAIDDQAQGPDSSFDEILLHAPGVSRESSGQYHLREEDYGLQYRLNGILLPDGITSTLGQPFDSRLIERMTIISGALPAEYGLRNAGVIDLETKTGTDLDGQEISMYGGSHATLHPSFSSGGVNGGTQYFVSGACLQDDLGTDNVTNSSRAIHDQTRQFQGFALLSQEIASGQKLSLILSGIDGTFQIPNAPGLTPSFAYDGLTSLNSSTLNRSQREENYYGIISYQIDTPDFQLSLAEVNGYSSTHYFPDYVGDLMFTGAASNAKRELFSTGVQLDVSYRLNETNTLKAGFQLTSQLERSRSTNAVFPTNPITGNVTSDLPETLNDSEHEWGFISGVYLQDEWQPLSNLTINSGGRLDFSKTYLTEDQFSPRINLVYRLTPAFTVNAGYARIFSPPVLEYIRPSVFAQFLNSTDAPTSLSDSIPHAERSHSFAAGATCEAVPGLSIGLQAYYKLVRNMQDETQLGQSLIFTPFTYEHGRKMGVELAANYKIDGFVLYTNLALARSEGRNINSSQGLFDPNELAYIAHHYIPTDYDQLWTISAGAAYRWRNFTWHTDLLAGSGMYGGFANSQKLQSHCTLNLGAEYRFLVFDKTTVVARFDIINGFDQRYLLHNAGIGATVDQYGERRGFFGGMSLDF
jgi:TonB dependent receptor